MSTEPELLPHERRVEDVMRAILRKWKASAGQEGPPHIEWAEIAARAALSVALPMQEPVAWRYRCTGLDGKPTPWVFTHIRYDDEGDVEVQSLYAIPAASVAPAVKVKAFSETLNFYISEAEDGICRVPRQKLVEIQQQLRAVDALTSSTASGEDGWRDISSAPKDGTWIFVHWQHQSIGRFPFVAFWDDGWVPARDADRDYGEVFPSRWRPMFGPPLPSSSKEDGNAR